MMFDCICYDILKFKDIDLPEKNLFVPMSDRYPTDVASV